MIFVSAPYSDSDPEVVERRFNTICTYCATLMATSRRTVISPIIPGHVLRSYADLPGDFEYWKQYCMDLLNSAKEVHVLMMNGWDSSVGVNAEIKHAQELGLTIVYVPTP